MNETAPEVSEKDMIGSLLEEDISECSDLPSSYTRSQKAVAQTSPMKGFMEPLELKEDLGVQEIKQYQEFPSTDPQNFYFNNTQVQNEQNRQHSMSHGNGYQYFVQQQIPNYFQQPYQEMFFSHKRTRKTLNTEINDQSLIAQCRDQYASLVLQQSFINGNDFQKEKIFKGLEEDLFGLSKHKFGNYVIQKIIECGNGSMRQIIFNSLSQHMVDMCLDKFGCRVMQKIMEHMNNKQKEKQQFLQIVRPHILQLIFDQCGNHVVQKMIEIVAPEQTEFLIDIVDKNVEQIVSHSYGCRIAQKCLETYPNDKLQHLYFTLTPLIEQLSFCQYGNYIVQHMIIQGPQKCMDVIRAFMKQYILRIGQDKFASNVAQRYISKADDNDINEICQIALSENISNMPYLLILINNQFGNYVIQNLYTRCQERYKIAIHTQVKKYEDSQFTPYGRHFLQSMTRISC